MRDADIVNSMMHAITETEAHLCGGMDKYHNQCPDSLDIWDLDVSYEEHRLAQ